MLIEYSNTCSIEFCASNSPLSIQCIKPNSCSDKNFSLKINPKDNTISIRKVKNSWNREELQPIIDFIKEIADDDLDRVSPGIRDKAKQQIKFFKDNL